MSAADAGGASEPVAALVAEEGDDVAVVLLPVPAGGVVSLVGPREGRVTARQAVPQFHKIALVDRAAGEPLRRAGTVIGELTAAVAAGDLVHTHNLVSRRARAGGGKAGAGKA